MSPVLAGGFLTIEPPGKPETSKDFETVIRSKYCG